MSFVCNVFESTSVEKKNKWTMRTRRKYTNEKDNNKKNL